MKKYLLLLFAALSCYSTVIFAQVSVDWLRYINDHPEGGDAIASDASNNSYAAGHGGAFIYLTKRDQFGNFQWKVTSTSILGEIPVRVFIDPQGNPVIVGYRYSTLHEGPFAVSLIVLKYDPGGNLIYKKSIDGTYTYFNNSANRTNVTAQMDAAGNVYIATGGIVNGYPNHGFNVVKVSSGGNIIWVRTETFGGSPFYLVSNIRLKGNKLGLVGPTLYHVGNPGIWVLDTAGVTTWSKIATGFGASDITMDDNANAYVLSMLQNIAGANTGSDVCLYKFNSTGKKLWLQGYDFGSNEGGMRIEHTPDNNLAIMADGSQINGGLPYVDWITLKVDLNGNSLWSKRYDKTINNDELPRMMLVDTKSNVYITGNGGPFPGGSNLGALQGVTLKYSSKGQLLWAALLDTLNFNGVGIAMGTDTSLFVISASASAVVHYLQNNGTDLCTVPSNLSVANISADAATIHWNAVANAFLYHIEYKTSTSNLWIALSTNTTAYALTGLSLGTMYDYRIEAVCNSGPTGFSPASQFTTLGTGYCISKGLDASKEWIDYVGMNAISNLSAGNNGYADFTSMSADLVRGSTNSIILRQGMNPGVYNETWRVWIDYNHDGDFTDANEKIAGYKSSTAGLVFTSFVVPLNAVIGNTRMRISMKKGTPGQTSCEIFSRGEVEDYTVNIISGAGTINSMEMNSPLAKDSKVIPAVSAFPNPAKNDLTAKFTGFEGSVTVRVLDVFGKVIFTGTTNSENQFKLDVHQFASGMYILRASDEKGRTASLKWIKE